MIYTGFRKNLDFGINASITGLILIFPLLLFFTRPYVVNTVAGAILCKVFVFPNSWNNDKDPFQYVRHSLCIQEENYLPICNIIAEGFRFIYLAFGVKLDWEPFSSVHRLIRNKLEHKCWRPLGEDVSFTDVKIKIPDRKVDQWMWMTSCTVSVYGGFWGFWKSQLVESCGQKKKGDFRKLAVPLCWWVGRWKSQHRKIVPKYLCRKTF